MLKHMRSSPITYSQNFIAKRHVGKKIVSYIPKTFLVNNHVIEIGPGKGRLTEFLIRNANRLTLIEIDYNLWKLLQRKYKGEKNITVLCGDFIDYELPSEPYVVVSNLPFFLARAMLTKLLKTEHRPQALYVVVQKELYAEFRRLSRQYKFSFRLLHTFKRADFEPMPRVESVFVEIIPR